ncbi:transducin/WD40 repeat-like superfamily protein isoform X2 [Wolffia australiana]
MDQFEEDATSRGAGAVPFQLQLDKPIPSQIIIAEWNPEKDLLAMVSEDFRIFLHRFNWQRLWTLSPGKCITSLCWRPDGKMIAVGFEDGSIALHDVENGKLLRSTRSHCAPVVCLNWEEDAQPSVEESNANPYEDRTSRFFPPAPRNPQMPGLGSGDAGLSDGLEDTFGELSCSLHNRLNILCSGDKSGDICFSIFGIFPIGKINIHNMGPDILSMNGISAPLLTDVSLHKLSLSRNLCQLTVLALGHLPKDRSNDYVKQKKDCNFGMHFLRFDTSIFHMRNELYQVALHASSIEDLIGVVRVSLAVMNKQWSDAMSTFHEKLNSLSSLIVDHGLDSSPDEEFLSLLLGARSSPPLHQFLVNSLGEVGLKRITKAVDGAAKDITVIIREHLQPAAEVIGFRIGELRGLSRWRSRYHNVGLDEKVINNAAEKAALLLVQVERFLRVLAIVTHELQNFFSWLMRCIKLLMSESTTMIAQPDIELIITYLKFHFNWDPVKHFLEASSLFHDVEVDVETMERVEELKAFGGFMDSAFLSRTLAQEFAKLEDNFKEVFSMPFSAVSRRIRCENFLPLYPISSASPAPPSNISSAVSYCKDEKIDGSIVDYICFKLPDDCLDMRNNIGIIRRFSSCSGGNECVESSFQALILRIPSECKCVDLALYKDGQVVLLLNERMTRPESMENASMMMFRAGTLPFTPIVTSTTHHRWKLQELMASAVVLDLGCGKLRKISHHLSRPLAVSASRGVACVFAGRKRALVYILDEDEDEDD